MKTNNLDVPPFYFLDFLSGSETTSDWTQCIYKNGMSSQNMVPPKQFMSALSACKHDAMFLAALSQIPHRGSLQGPCTVRSLQLSHFGKATGL